jgi:hypothetical protein
MDAHLYRWVVTCIDRINTCYLRAAASAPGGAGEPAAASGCMPAKKGGMGRQVGTVLLVRDAHTWMCERGWEMGGREDTHLMVLLLVVHIRRM